jgi:hypothetical protein
MPNIAGFNLQLPTDQAAVMVMKALALKGPSTRDDTVRYIANLSWFALADEDRAQYPSDAERGRHVPRWHVLLAFGREKAAELNYIPRGERDCWDVVRPGLEALAEIERGFRQGLVKAHKCFLWSHSFKKLMSGESYVEGNDDPRPEIYRDWPQFFAGRISDRVQRVRLAMKD